METKESCRIESREEVETYLARLRYALDTGAKISFQEKRLVDENRPLEYTNKFTVADLFPNENPIEMLKRELRTLSVQNYLRTVKDLNFKNRSEMREFGKIYPVDKEVYIKIRVEIFGGNPTPLFVMSFHYAMKPFSQEVFPYKD